MKTINSELKKSEHHRIINYCLATLDNYSTYVTRRRYHKKKLECLINGKFLTHKCKLSNVLT